MSGTTMILFKTALIAAVKARASTPGTAIGYGERPDTMKRSIRFREAVSTEGDGVKPSGFRGGRPKMDEKYTLHVVCERIGLATPEACEADVVAMADQVEDALWDVYAERVPGVYEATVSGRALNTDEAGGTRSVFELFITVKARTL